MMCNLKTAKFCLVAYCDEKENLEKVNMNEHPDPSFQYPLHLHSHLLPRPEKRRKW